MNTYKKYLVFAYYGHEGWSIVGQADTSEEILAIYKEKVGWGQETLVVKNIPVVLKVEEEEGG